MGDPRDRPRPPSRSVLLSGHAPGRGRAGRSCVPSACARRHLDRCRRQGDRRIRAHRRGGPFHRAPGRNQAASTIGSASPWRRGPRRSRIRTGFRRLLGAMDFHLIAEGNHLELYRRLGAHEATIDDVPGVVFSVWAPNARRVSVVGPFNAWDGRRHPMRCHFGIGVWEIFIPGIRAGRAVQVRDQGRERRRAAAQGRSAGAEGGASAVHGVHRRLSVLRAA